MRVLMEGATGRHAHLVLHELTKRGVAVRAILGREPRSLRDYFAELTAPVKNH